MAAPTVSTTSQLKEHKLEPKKLKCALANELSKTTDTFEPMVIDKEHNIYSGKLFDETFCDKLTQKYINNDNNNNDTKHIRTNLNEIDFELETKTSETNRGVAVVNVDDKQQWQIGNGK